MFILNNKSGIIPVYFFLIAHFILMVGAFTLQAQPMKLSPEEISHLHESRVVPVSPFHPVMPHQVTTLLEKALATYVIDVKKYRWLNSYPESDLAQALTLEGYTHDLLLMLLYHLNTDDKQRIRETEDVVRYLGRCIRQCKLSPKSVEHEIDIRISDELVFSLEMHK